MSNFKRTRIEISGEGDIELLDHALQGMGVGAVERSTRLLNIKSLETLQFSFTRSGKRRVWQPFRAEYKRDAAGKYIVTTDNKLFYAQEFAKQAGFTVGNVTLGDYPDNGPGSAVTLTYSCTINGRTLNVKIHATK